jgi:hypothetical protein
VTIVLRTRREEEFSPQKIYLLPGIALDPAAEDPLLARRLALIDGMLRTGFADVGERVNRIIAAADLRTAFRVLQHLARRSAAPEVLSAATTVMRSHQILNAQYRRDRRTERELVGGVSHNTKRGIQCVRPRHSPVACSYVPELDPWTASFVGQRPQKSQYVPTSPGPSRPALSSD